MRLAQLEVTGLFDQYNHVLPFPEQPQGEPRPSIVILFGPNGVGKTTLLNMLAGLMRLNFNIFRQVPFSRCCLTFSGGASIEVEPVSRKRGRSPLAVSFSSHNVHLHPSQPGPLDEADKDKVETFRQDFFAAVSDLTLELIDTRRLLTLHDVRRAEAARHDPRFGRGRQWLLPADYAQHGITFGTATVIREPVNPKALPEEATLGLADRVTRFIADAQVNYRQFFAVAARDMFARLLAKVSESKGKFSIPELRSRMDALAAADSRVAPLGLEPVASDHEQLASALAKAGGPQSESLLAMVGAYVEMLEARAEERELLAQRLIRFENLINGFLAGKSLAVNAKDGFRITNHVGRRLSEFQLSSGEFHLLYLMVSALIVRRAGTVMAIDEPEMSMHLAWQRQLVKALSSCATGAEPQFILATHSPDVAAEYSDSMIELKVQE